MIKLLDLFSGIGGFSLGLERSGGFQTVAFCEIEPFCRAVLRKHWPEVPCYEDVRSLTAERLAADGISVDAICGGFPCQDISVAGKGAGLAGERSGLWREYARLIGEIRPRYVIVENVAALLGRGLGDVLGDLAALGYDAEWHCIPAADIGAPHRRDRVWIAAYGAGAGRAEVSAFRHIASGAMPIGNGQAGRLEDVADATGGRARRGRERPDAQPVRGSQDVADTDCEREPQSERRFCNLWRRIGDGSCDMANSNGARLSFSWQVALGEDWQQGRGAIAANRWWTAEPNVGRMAHGVPARVDRLKSLGNAVVPQIPELIGRAIVAATQRSST